MTVDEPDSPGSEKVSADVLLKGVELRFAGREEPVIAGLDLDIREGEFVAVIGPSGCGKTTLLRLVHGLVKPTDGTVLAGGEIVDKPNRSRGFVFQSDCLMPWRRVVDNVGFPLELAGCRRNEARVRARELLALIGLRHSADLYPGQLSGGMRQRVNIARALVIDPAMLLMDEPFAALDAQTREVLQSELLTIWARHRKTVLFVTHQLDEAVFLADRVVVLEPHPGRVRAVVPIDLPRPRSLDVKRTPAFSQKVEILWDLIKADVLAESVV